MRDLLILPITHNFKHLSVLVRVGLRYKCYEHVHQDELHSRDKDDKQKERDRLIHQDHVVKRAQVAHQHHEQGRHRLGQGTEGGQLRTVVDMGHHHEGEENHHVHDQEVEYVRLGIAKRPEYDLGSLEPGGEVVQQLDEEQDEAH
jgi:hypothetical protein